MNRNVATILHLEDSALDAELIKDRLEKSGLAVAIELVEDRKEFVAKLTARPYDLILSDYEVPGFNGLAALALTREHQPDTPFIFVSGAMGEELAVDTLKRGATDYVLKHRLMRLPTAVERALAESRDRSARRTAEERAAVAAKELRASEEWLKVALAASRMGTWVLDLATRRLACSDMCKTNYGVDVKAEFSYEDLVASILDEDRPRWRQLIDDAIGRAGEFEVEYRIRWSDGSVRWVHVRGSCSRTGEKPTVMSGVSFDITDRKRTEEDLARLLIKEKRHTALLERVAQASRSMNAELSAESIARSLTQEACSILSACFGVTTVHMAEDVSAEVRATATAANAEADAAALEAMLDPALVAAVSRDHQPLRVSGQEAAPCRPGQLVAPLIGPGGKLLGVIQLVTAQGGAFSAEDEAVVMQLAAIASVGLENARLYELLYAQDRRKDEFLATLAHELRNPLAPVRNGLQILKITRNEGQARHVREMMERQLGHMVRLIDDLMDLSRITRGRVELRKERVELRTVVDSAVEASRPLIDASGHALAVDVPDGVYLEADPTRMAQVLANLLNNSAKYTPHGGRIQLRADRVDHTAIVRVVDTGVGIPAEMLPRVFDMFTQVGRTLDRSQGGLGIGLTLVRRLVEMHGGTVAVESAGPGAGTTFIVQLPTARDEEAAANRPTTSPN